MLSPHRPAYTCYATDAGSIMAWFPRMGPAARPLLRHAASPLASLAALAGPWIVQRLLGALGFSHCCTSKLIPLNPPQVTG